MRSKALRLVDDPGFRVAGWACVRRSLILGQGRGVFDEAVVRIRSGRMHRSIGIGFRRRDAAVRLRILGLPNWCEVIEDRLGDGEYEFVYRAGARHVLSGEEAFVVRLDDAGAVTATVAAVSRPVWAPLNRLQGWAMAGYLRGMGPRGHRKAQKTWRNPGKLPTVKGR